MFLLSFCSCQLKATFSHSTFFGCLFCRYRYRQVDRIETPASFLRFYCWRRAGGWHAGEDLNVAWRRHQIGYVSQEPTLFPGTIKDNILAGKLDATDEEVFEAARSACAHEFILSFPDGYETFHSGASIQLRYAFLYCS